MKFAKAAAVAALLIVVGALHDAAAGTISSTASNSAIFVANEFNVTAYPLGSTGDVSPIAQTTDLALATGIARDSSGRLYVTNAASNTITVYAANVNGNVPPIAVIGGSNTQLSIPVGIALDATEKIYVANGQKGTENSVTIYPPLGASTGILNEAPAGVITGSKTLLDTPMSIALDSHANIYVANESGSPAVPHQRFDVGRITVYAAGSSGNVAPIATISGAKTGLAVPIGITLDSADIIYVYNLNTANTGDKLTFQITSSITIYQAGSKGDASPIALIAGSNTGLFDLRGMAVDSSGNLYVGGCPNNQCFSIEVYPPGSNGNVSPASTIFDTGIDPIGITLDPARNIYVLNAEGGTVPGGGIVVYPAGSSGNAIPSATIYSNSTGFFLATGVALDSSGKIYVVDGGAINIYPAGSYATGISPITRITGPDTGLARPASVALDSNGDIFALNLDFDDVTEYPAGSSGDAMPTASFSYFSRRSGPLTGLAVSPLGRLYATVGSATAGCKHRCHQIYNGAVVVWPPESNGNQMPSAVIVGAKTNLESPSAIAVDRGGSMYVTNQGPLKCKRGCGCAPNGSGSVTVYASGADGDAKPIATISGSNTGITSPDGITLDSKGNIYVLNAADVIPICGSYPRAIPDGGRAILVFGPNSEGDVAPIATIGGPFTGLNFPSGIAIGPNGP